MSLNLPRFLPATVYVRIRVCMYAFISDCAVYAQYFVEYSLNIRNVPRKMCPQITQNTK